MSAIPASNVPRKSFAQVAAEANTPIIINEKSPNSPSPNITVSTGTKLSNAALARLSNAPEYLGDGTSSGQRSVHTPASVSSDVDQLNNLLQTATLQDAHLHSLPNDHLSRREFDTKSVASRTTLTLDEKESLRPDDSASMQAAPEEDAFSPAGSVVAGSKEGSDPEARAFRDQLNVLERVAPPKILTQGPLPEGGLPVEMRDGTISFSNPPVASPFAPSEASSFERPKATSGMPFIPPDEKLLEALASPKDRLFVLKIEQDMIDFVKDSKEEFLQLPQTNAFYRMLSHKLADYYFLGHIIDESLTSVRIYRTPHCRLPPPLIGPISATDGGTPPTMMPSRKIMKRGGGNGQNDPRMFMSRTSSKGAGDGDDSKDKSALSREERENRYKEARARIFKDFKEENSETADITSKTPDKDVSRSSSASGAKKGKKKKPKDDEFEPRSAFTGISPFAPPASKPGSDGTFYNPFAPYALGNQSFNGVGSFDSVQTAQGGLPSHLAQPPNPAFNAWSSQQAGQGFMMAQAASPYGGQNFYENSSGSYASMPSPQNMSNQLTPRPTNPSLSVQPGGFAPTDENMGWQQNYVNQYPMQGGMANGAFFDPNMVSNPMMYGMPAYGPQDPQMQSFQFMSQGRQQFNPRSQAFVPGVWGQNMQNVPAGYFNSGFPTYQGQPSMMPATPSAPQQPMPKQFVQNPTSTPRANGAMQHLQARPSPATNGSRPSPSGTSSIAKWGTPSTLPPKPPPPAIFSPFVELPRDPQNQQPLPPNPYTNGMRNGNAPKVGGSR